MAQTTAGLVIIQNIPHKKRDKDSILAYAADVFAVWQKAYCPLRSILFEMILLP
jgi:hypothetical protein